MDSIVIKVDPQQKKELIALAEKRDRNVSQVIRGLIRFYLESDKDKNTAKLFKQLGL